MYALVFVVIAIVGAFSCSAREKSRELILIERHCAYVCIVILVVVVKNAALAVRGCFFLVISIIHIPIAPSHVFESVKTVLKDYLCGECVDDLLSLCSAGVCLVEIA